MDSKKSCYIITTKIDSPYARIAGREIEFTYGRIPCAITNSERMWWFTCGKDSEAICEFKDKEQLIRKAEKLEVSHTTLRDIFDGLLYEKESFYIL